MGSQDKRVLKTRSRTPRGWAALFCCGLTIAVVTNEANAQNGECLPHTSGMGCLPTDCPIDGEECIPQSVQCDPNGICFVTECDCQNTQRCRMIFDPPNFIDCGGICPPGAECERVTTQLPSGFLEFRCECIGEECGPNPEGTDCQSVECPIDNQECVPTTALCVGPGVCHIVECDCRNPEFCHLELPTPTAPICVGGCPPGLECVQTNVTTGQGTLVRCDCVPQGEVACCFPDGSCAHLPPEFCESEGGVPQGPGSTCNDETCAPEECGPTPNFDACRDVECPIDGQECIPVLAQCDPTGLFCQVAECECRDPEVCHVALLAIPGVACEGGCPPGFECVETIGEMPNGITVRCDCRPIEDQACCFSDGSCAHLPPEFCESEGGVPQGVGSTCNDETCVPQECGPHPNGDRCTDVVCPNPNHQCVPREIICGPGPTAGCFITECECGPPNECHVDLDPPAFPFCTGLCPPGFDCEEFVEILPTDQTLHKCGCVPPTEACCLPTGCEALSVDACESAGGEPLGAGSVCNEPKPCCFVGDIFAECVDMDPQCCEINGGIVQDGNAECNEPRACCLGEFCVMIDPLCCDDLGGNLVPGVSSCENNPCDSPECAPTPNGDRCQPTVCENPNEVCVPTRVFCVGPGVCTVVECECRDPGLCHIELPTPTAPTCVGACPPGFDCELRETSSSQPKGAFLECVCVPPVQGCCLNDGCEELPTDLCVELGGEPLGPGSECQEPRPCCFVGDVSALCVDMDPRCCENSGGIPQSENLECTEPVACCLGQACFMVDRVCCDELGGVSHGPGSNCENNPCDPQECGPTTDGLGCQNVVCPDPNEECVPTVAHCDPTGLFCQVVECECQDPDLCHVQTHDVPVGFDCGGVCPPGFECFERIEGIPNGIQVSCDCVPGEPEGCCFPGGGCANLPPGFCELEGGVPLGPGTNCAVAGICTEPPRIVHETGPNARTRPCTGYIDPRIESTNGADLNAGLQIADILFTVPVFGTPAGGAVTPANFAMSEQCLGATPPTITSVSPIAANLRHWRVEWDRPLTLQEYTTLRATVFNAIGIPIINVGNLGPGMSEPDRVDYGFLPADADNNETVQPLDLLRMRQKLSGTCPPAPTCPDCGGERLYFDIDRNGAIQALDLLRWRQLWFGTGPATQPWQAESMLCNQP